MFANRVWTSLLAFVVMFVLGVAGVPWLAMVTGVHDPWTFGLHFGLVFGIWFALIAAIGPTLNAPKWFDDFIDPKVSAVKDKFKTPKAPVVHLGKRNPK